VTAVLGSTSAISPVVVSIAEVVGRVGVKR
jgi:hypothetical protein